MEGCIFCKIASGEAPARIVYETPRVMAFWDISPKAPQHFLIIPRKHISRLVDLQEEDALLMGEVLLAAAEVARREGATNGFRLVANNGAEAGQSIFHVHFHLLAGRRMGWPPG